MESYWARFGGQRLSRRRALALTGATAGSAAILAACGGSSSSSSGPGAGGGAGNGLVTAPVDVTNRAKVGGVYKWFVSQDSPSFDQHLSQQWIDTAGGMVYSRLFHYFFDYTQPTENAV